MYANEDPEQISSGWFSTAAGVIGGVTAAAGGAVVCVNQLFIMAAREGPRTVERSPFAVAEIAAVVGGFALVGIFLERLSEKGRRRIAGNAVLLLLAAISFTLFGLASPLYEALVTAPALSFAMKVWLGFGGIVAVASGVVGTVSLGFGMGYLIASFGEVSRITSGAEHPGTPPRTTNINHSVSDAKSIWSDSTGSKLDIASHR